MGSLRSLLFLYIKDIKMRFIAVSAERGYLYDTIFFPLPVSFMIMDIRMILYFRCAAVFCFEVGIPVLYY